MELVAETSLFCTLMAPGKAAAKPAAAMASNTRKKLDWLGLGQGINTKTTSSSIKNAVPAITLNHLNEVGFIRRTGLMSASKYK